MRRLMLSTIARTSSCNDIPLHQLITLQLIASAGSTSVNQLVRETVNTASAAPRGRRRGRVPHACAGHTCDVYSQQACVRHNPTSETSACAPDRLGWRPAQTIRVNIQFAGPGPPAGRARSSAGPLLLDPRIVREDDSRAAARLTAGLGLGLARCAAGCSLPTRTTRTRLIQLHGVHAQGPARRHPRQVSGWVK